MSEKYSPMKVRDIAEVYGYVLELRVLFNNEQDSDQKLKIAKELVRKAIPHYRKTIPLEVRSLLCKVEYPLNNLQRACLTFIRSEESLVPS